MSRVATGFWGLFASVVAVWAAELGSLIEVVNRFGSFFYGSILGVFILAIGFPRATANGAFVGLLAGMASVALAATYTKRRVSLAQRDRRRRLSVDRRRSCRQRWSPERVRCSRMIRIFVTGGTFDKTYDEIRGRLAFGDTPRAGDAAARALTRASVGRDADDGRQPRHDR